MTYKDMKSGPCKRAIEKELRAFANGMEKLARTEDVWTCAKVMLMVETLMEKRGINQKHTN